MQSLVRILKVNEVREGVSKITGKPWRMQDCECTLETADGLVDQVGVLMLAPEMVGNTVPGLYAGSFALHADTSREGQRRIMARLTALVPVPPQRAPVAPSVKPAGV